MGHHKKLKLGDKMRRSMAISKEAYAIIDSKAKGNNITKIEMVDMMVRFYDTKNI